MKISKYFVLLLITMINCEDNHLVFKFMTNINLNDVNDENYMRIKYDQKIYVELEIGHPPQKIPMTLKTLQFPTFIVSSEVKDNIKVKFDPKKSDTFRNESSTPITETHRYDFAKSYFSKDILNINPSLKNFSFYLATEMPVTTKNISGEIGLSKYSPIVVQHYKESEFLQQLLENKLINKKIFGIIYDTEYEGRLIFGAYMHEIDKNYEEKYMKEFELDTSKVYHNNKEMWLMPFELNCLDGKNNSIIYNENTFGFLYYEYGLMIGSYNFQMNFVKNYFLNKKCENETVDASSHFTEYYCKNESQFEDFPNITFVVKAKYGVYNFSFTKDDLFVKRGNKYIFQIVFDIFVEQGPEYWNIGQTFFRKYAIFLKQEEKENKLAYYTYHKTGSEPDNGDDNTKMIIIIVLSVVLGLIIIGIILYFIYLYPKTRKKRAQELDDNYEYKSKEEPKEKLVADDKEE